MSKDTKVFAVAYEISHARADLIEIEMKLERVHTRVRALSGAQTASSTIYDCYTMCGARLSSQCRKTRRLLDHIIMSS